MIYVRKDDDEYISWLERHPDAFVLNVSTGGKHRAMLHTSRCGHLYPPGKELVHTGSYPKTCSSSRDELERWGTEQGLTVTLCPDCGVAHA